MITQQDQNILIKENHKKVYLYLLQLTKNKTLSDDLMQETCIKILAAFKNGSYKEDGNFIGFANTVARNLFIDYRRKIKRSKTMYFEDMTRFEITEEGYDKELTRKEKEIIINAVNLINKEYISDVLLLRIFYNLQFKKISQLMNTCVSTSLARMRYAVGKLAKN